MQGGHFSTFYKKVPKDFLGKSPQKSRKPPKKSRKPPKKSKKITQKGGNCGCATVPALPHSLGGRYAKRKRTQRRRNRA